MIVAGVRCDIVGMHELYTPLRVRLRLRRLTRAPVAAADAVSDPSDDEESLVEEQPPKRRRRARPGLELRGGAASQGLHNAFGVV